ncbi:DNA mismatch endonuclease Vsr [Micromonospora sp. NPDC047074]|uniref:DNA mismatch endonuclease Vsr n=1 Tax=Micromonospora sp. NPDC047074 TaxID=3154339 RepID=UPI0033EA8B70
MVTRLPGPQPVSEAVRKRFQRQRTRDTRPEILLRRLLHRRGLRYRVDSPLPGQRRRADLLFSKAKVAVFVDGCFWHRCPEHGTFPKNNGPWWHQKLERNVARDREVDSVLVSQGWLVIRIWEHEDPPLAAEKVYQAVRSRWKPAVSSKES